jgi:phospholipid/cholesterol/gamma-HCH transport system substrate-binding protein
MNSNRAALWVGVFVFAGLGVMIWLAMSVDDEANVFSSGAVMRTYYADFDSALGIKEQDPIFVAGQKAGFISTITYMGLKPGEGEPRVRVKFTVAEGHPVYENSPISVAQSNLLGGRRLMIRLPEEPGDELPENSELTNIEQQDFLATINSAFNQVAEVIEENRPSLRKTIDNIRDVTDSLNQTGTPLGNLINDEQMGADLKDTFDRVSNISKNIDEVANELNRSVQNNESLLAKLLRDPKTSESFSEIVENARSASDSISDVASRLNDPEARGTIPRLLNDEELSQNVSDAVANVEGTFEEAQKAVKKVNEGDGTIAKLVNESEIYDNANETVADVRAMVAHVKAADKSTLGQIVMKDDLSRQLNRLLVNATEAVEDAREQAPISAFGTALIGGLQ